MGDPLTSLEGGAGVGSGLGKGYKWPSPSAPLHRGPLEDRSAPGGHFSRLFPGGWARSGLRDRSAAAKDAGLRGLPDKWLSPRLEPRRGALGARDLSAGSAAAESGKTSAAAGSVARQERGHRAGRPRRAHHGLLLGHRGPAVRAARRSAALR